MSQLQKGLVFALIQVIFVASLGAKLLWDRERLPRGWAATQGYDPNLPIRGRYINITLLVKADKVYAEPSRTLNTTNVYLTVEDGQVVANPADHFTGLTLSGPRARNGQLVAALSPPVVFFLPEHAADPMRGRPAAMLYLEVTVPRKGPPRPIRFEVQNGREITPRAVP